MFADTLLILRQLRRQDGYWMMRTVIGCAIGIVILINSPLANIGAAEQLDGLMCMALSIAMHWVAMWAAITHGASCHHQSLDSQRLPRTLKKKAKFLRWGVVVAMVAFFIPLIASFLYETITGEYINAGGKGPAFLLGTLMGCTLSFSVLIGWRIGWNSVEIPVDLAKTATDTYLV